MNSSECHSVSGCRAQIPQSRNRQLQGSENRQVRSRDLNEEPGCSEVVDPWLLPHCALDGHINPEKSSQERQELQNAKAKEQLKKMVKKQSLWTRE